VALTGHYLPTAMPWAVFCGVGFSPGLPCCARCSGGISRRSAARCWSLACLLWVWPLAWPILQQRAEFWRCPSAADMPWACSRWGGVVGASQPVAAGLVARRGKSGPGHGCGGSANLAAGSDDPSGAAGAGVAAAVVIGLRPPPWNLLVAAFLPLVLCGLGLMLYNDLRFGSPFEFGQHYQLAGDRQGCRGAFQPGFSMLQFSCLFPGAGRWSWKFPFVEGIAPLAVPAGHAKIEDPFGVLTNVPVVWLALALPLVLRDPHRGRLAPSCADSCRGHRSFRSQRVGSWPVLRHLQPL